MVVYNPNVFKTSSISELHFLLTAMSKLRHSDTLQISLSCYVMRAMILSKSLATLTGGLLNALAILLW